MAVPSRSTPTKASPAKRPSTKTPLKLASPGPAPSAWGEARVVLAMLFGLFAMFLCSQTLGETESETFSTFLKGQIGWSFDALSSALFWKMTVAFLLGAGGGYLAGLEIPRSLLAKANFAARVIAIFGLTLVIYIPAMTAGFLWDDDQEITANPSLTNAYGLWEIWTGGITYDKREETDPVVKASKQDDPPLVNALRVPLRVVEKCFWPDTKFKPHQSADYFPLKTTMLWVEFQLWGRNPDGSVNSVPFHVMNIIMHAIDALLLWMLLSQLKVPGAWFAGLLFAIHPVHVESVAWIAERKNTLSLFFYLLSISAWVKFEDTWKAKHPDTSKWPWQSVQGKTGTPNILSETFHAYCDKFYLFSIALCLAALLCKTSVVVLPAVLAICIWWRTGKLTPRDCLLVLPVFLVSLGLAEVTIWFQNGRAIGQEVIPIGPFFWSRIAGAGFAAFWYLEKVLLPIHLNTIYNAVPILSAELLKKYGIIQEAGPQASQFIKGAVVIILLISSLAAYLLYDKRRTRLGRTPFFVLAYFFGTLFPVLGFFTMSYMRVALQADHFQYLSDIAVIAFVAAGITYGWQKASSRIKPLIVAACTLLLCTFCAYSWDLAGVHQSEKTLWTACLALNDDSWQAHNHLGAVVYMEGDINNAHYHFQRAVDLKPQNPEVHNNLGLTLSQFGRMEEALEQYRKAVEIKGDVPAMRRNYADCLARLNHFDEAATQYKIVLDQDSNDPNSHFGYGIVLLQLHRLPEAQDQFEKTLKLDPNNQHARQNLEAVKKMIGS